MRGAVLMFLECLRCRRAQYASKSKEDKKYSVPYIRAPLSLVLPKRHNTNTMQPNAREGLSSRREDVVRSSVRLPAIFSPHQTSAPPPPLSST